MHPIASDLRQKDAVLCSCIFIGIISTLKGMGTLQSGNSGDSSGTFPDEPFQNEFNYNKIITKYFEFTITFVYIVAGGLV